MTACDELDEEAEALRQAAENHGVAYSIERLARPGEAEVSWLRLVFPHADFLFARGRFYHAGVGDQASGPHLNGEAARETSDKAGTLLRLRARGISVPEGLFQSDEEDAAVAYARQLGSEVCIKPNAGAKGLYVYPKLREPTQLRAAFRKAKRLPGGVLVERSLPGEMLRHFFVAPEIVATKSNQTPEVVGDGVQKIVQLVNARNALITGRGPFAHKAVSITLAVLRSLRAEGCTPDTVLDLGRRVRLGSSSNISSGGESHNYADTHPSYAAAAAQACSAVPGLRIAAVDMIAADRTRPALAGR